MTAKRSRTTDATHPGTGSRHSKPGKKRDEHTPPRAGEHRIDETVEDSFPASDPPAHGTDPGVDPTLHVKDTPPVEGEREPDDDEGGIGGEVRRPEHEGENTDPLERGED